jgi:hypothetical protein
VEAVQTLYTAVVGRSGHAFQCLVLNTGTRDVTVTVQALEFGNTVVRSEGPAELTPGAFSAATVLADVHGGLLYCKIIVHAGRKSSLRAG